MSDTHRVLGYESDLTVIQSIAPVAIADATPVLSTALDLRAYPRRRWLAIFSYNEVGATAHTLALTVTESATSGGEYTAASTSGTLTALSADGIQKASVKFNPAKPFVIFTLTGSHADVDGIGSVTLIGIPDFL